MRILVLLVMALATDVSAQLPLVADADAKLVSQAFAAVEANEHAFESARFAMIAKGEYHIKRDMRRPAWIMDVRYVLVREDGRELAASLIAFRGRDAGWEQRFNEGGNSRVRTPRIRASERSFKTYQQKELERTKRIRLQPLQLPWTFITTAVYRGANGDLFDAFKQDDFTLIEAGMNRFDQLVASYQVRNREPLRNAYLRFASKSGGMPVRVELWTDRDRKRTMSSRIDISWEQHGKLWLPTKMTGNLTAPGESKLDAETTIREAKLELRWKVADEISPDPLLNVEDTDWRQRTAKLFGEDWHWLMADDK